jgi:hypothetical protein
MEKKSIYLAIILAVAFLLIGFGIGNFYGKMAAEKIYQGKLAEKERELTEKEKEIGWWKSQLEMFYLPLPEEIYSISGKITKIEGNSIWIESQIRLSRLPLPGGKEFETKEIKVNVLPETKIVKVEIPPVPPLPTEQPFKEVPLKFEDLKVGDQITVTSKENIKGKTEILAERIQLTY